MQLKQPVVIKLRKGEVKKKPGRRRKISGEPVFFALLHFLSIDVVHGSNHRFALKNLK